MNQGILESYNFLKECGTYYIATIKDGAPTIRPFGTVNIFEDKLYIQTGKVKDCYKEMLLNPHIAICAFLKGKWIRIEAEVVSDDRLIAKQDMLNKYPGLHNMYKADDNNTIVLYLKNATSRICSFTASPIVYKF
jgi:uncharacterized pyridoxamine 5'-phosphate oxidase family protein